MRITNKGIDKEQHEDCQVFIKKLEKILKQKRGKPVNIK